MSGFVTFRCGHFHFHPHPTYSMRCRCGRAGADQVTLLDPPPSYARPHVSTARTAA